MNISCSAYDDFHEWTWKLAFFIIHKRLTIIICTARFNMFQSPLKIFMRMQNRIASFFYPHYFLFIYFCPAGGAHQQGRLIWLPSAPFSSESLVLCLLCCPIRASLCRKLSPQVRHGWQEMKRKEEVTWALPLNCYRSSYLKTRPPPFF